MRSRSAPPRLLSAITAEDLSSEISGWQADGTPATLRLKGVARRMHAAAVSLSVAPPTPSSTAQPTWDALTTALTKLAESSTKADTRKVTMASVIDPADSGEVPSAGAGQIKKWYCVYRARKSGDPLPDKDPTSDQVSAMHTRTVVLLQEPYADFSVLTPHGRRMAKILRHRSWLLQEDGSYKPIEVPGPESFATWEACWKVYEVILIMLQHPPASDSGDPVDVISLIALEAYYEAFAQLCRENPESWHLCCAAEDRCRAEHIPRLARQIEAKTGQLPTWSQIFMAAAEDGTYWDREVRRPANAWIARGYHLASATTAAERALTQKVLQGSGACVIDKTPLNLTDNNDHGKSNRRKKKMDNNMQKMKGAGKHDSKGTKKGKDGEHPKRNNKGQMITTPSGQEICFKYANHGLKGCATPCSAKRAHACMKCGQAHPNSECKPK